MSPRVALLLAACVACSGGSRATPTSAAPQAVPDAELGLAKGSVFDVPSPPKIPPNESAPGEVPPPPRAYPQAPPSVPHAIADFLPITAAQNACVDCHSTEKKEPGQPTPIPPSHYADLRGAAGAVGKSVSGARWVCTACHVPRTAAPPLVGNSFRR